MRKAIFAALAAAGLAVTGACSGEAEVDADLSADSEGSVEEYCDLAAEFDQRDSVPSDAELDSIVEASPDEIRADVEVLVEAIKDGDQESEAAAEAAENLEAWEADNCDNNVSPGGSNGDDGAEVDGGVDVEAEVDGQLEGDDSSDGQNSESETEETTSTTS